MHGDDATDRRLLSVGQVAEILRLPDDGVVALARAGYLATASDAGESRFALVDVKAFLARNADNGAGNVVLHDPGSIDPGDLLAALDGQSEAMARRAYDIFATVFPETVGWSDAERAKFVEQSKARFEAILAVASQGAEVDEALVDDLMDVGAAAAWAGSPLPHLLVVLRISRDLVVQTAVELAEERGRHWGLALSLLLTRVLPAMDRLTDSLAQGYWNAIIGREADQKARYEHVVEHSSDGVYEIDLDERVQYANPSLAEILGQPLDALVGERLPDALGAVHQAPLAARKGHVELALVRPDGVRRVVEVRTTERRFEGELIGSSGVVRDVTSARDLEADRNAFVALMTQDLRQPLRSLADLASSLERSDGADPDRARRIGSAIRSETERMGRLADDLFDVSRLEAHALLLDPRPVELASVVDAAIASVGPATDVHVDVPAGTKVLADARRLEQVVANLVENALAYGEPPIEVRAGEGRRDASVELTVVDHGKGVPLALEPSLFDRLRLLSRRDRDRQRSGLGLPLVKGLVEAMGGGVRYERAPDGGATFRVLLPTPVDA